MRSPLVRALSVLSAALLSLAPAPPAAAPEDPQAPRVLIATPDPDGVAEEYRELLEDRGIPAIVLPWEEATVERARDFDLVVVAGDRRTVDEDRAVCGYDRPVLGIGPYGCRYFGHQRLKNGHPHT